MDADFLSSLRERIRKSMLRINLRRGTLVGVPLFYCFVIA